MYNHQNLIIMSSQTILNHIHSRGVTIIRTLNQAMLLFEGIPFESDSKLKTQKEYEETLEDLIIDIASLCCEEDTWDATRTLLDKAGIDVAEEYDLQRRFLEREMDRDYPENRK